MSHIELVMPDNRDLLNDITNESYMSIYDVRIIKFRLIAFKQQGHICILTRCVDVLKEEYSFIPMEGLQDAGGSIYIAHNKHSCLRYAVESGVSVYGFTTQKSFLEWINNN